MAYQFTKTWAQIWALINNAMQIGVDRVSAGQISGTAIGTQATSEGHNTNASGMYSHAEGDSTTASVYASHSEGADTTASGSCAHAEGDSTVASSDSSHAEGGHTTASGQYSHAEGYMTVATGANQHVSGKYNIADGGNIYSEIIGNGTADNARSNARTLKWNGDETLAGKLTLGKRGTDPMDVATVGEALNAYATDNASGSIASFSDGADNIPMKSFVASIDPIQNLNGQSAPYPAGGGKNKLNPTGESGTSSGITTTKNSDGSYTVTGGNTAPSAVAILAGEWQATAGVTYTLNGCPSGGSNNSYRLDIRTGPTTPYQGTPVDTGSGVSITPSEDATLYVYMRYAVGYNISGSLSFKPMIRLATEADATFAPYSNVCPISGHNGVNAVVAGVNLFNIADVFSGTGQSVSGTTITKEYSGYYFDLLNGTTGSSSTATKKIYLPAGTYTISGTYTGTGSVRVYTCDADGVVASTHIAAITSSITSQTFTLAAASYITMRYGDRDACTTQNLQIEVGSSASTYEPYKGTTYPVTFYDGANPLTVYKGSIDLVSGVLTVTHKSDTISTEAAYGRSSGTNYFLRKAYLSAMPKYEQGVATVSSDRFISASASGAGKCFVNGSNDIRFNTSVEYESVSAMLAAIGVPQFVYELATLPDPVQLTPTEVLSLLGQNNVFADCGDTAVEYRADTKLYIDKMLGGNVQTLSAIRPTLGSTIVAPTEEPEEEGGVDNE